MEKIQNKYYELINSEKLDIILDDGVEKTKRIAKIGVSVFGFSFANAFGRAPFLPMLNRILLEIVKKDMIHARILMLLMTTRIAANVGLVNSSSMYM